MTKGLCQPSPQSFRIGLLGACCGTGLRFVPKENAGARPGGFWRWMVSRHAGASLLIVV
jgi:hypothetical protein